jgi:trypsin
MLYSTAIWTMFTLIVAALFLFLAPFSREVAAKQTASVIPLVLGGLQADKGRFPYLVSLLDDNFSHKCEGSLIAPDIVLTAAHCNP